MSLHWPEPMPKTGRLSDSTLAWMNGICLVIDPKMSCSQTLHITLFFDGTLTILGAIPSTPGLPSRH
jgi:hypothetical protein